MSTQLRVFLLTSLTTFPTIFFSHAISSQSYNSNDFYDLARTVDADELLEQIKLIDIFEHPKTKRTSHCYRLVYRHASRPLTQEEVNGVHEEIAGSVETRLGVEVRNKKTAKRK